MQTTPPNQSPNTETGVSAANADSNSAAANSNATTNQTSSAAAANAATNDTRPALIQPGAPANYCNICNKELCNKYFMKTHMQKMHGINLDDYPREAANSGGVVCDICQKELCSKYFLKVHKSNTHGVTEFATGPAHLRAALNLALNQQQQLQQEQQHLQQQQQRHQQTHNRKRHRGETTAQQVQEQQQQQQQQALLNAAVFNPAAAAAAMMAIQQQRQLELQSHVQTGAVDLRSQRQLGQDARVMAQANRLGGVGPQTAIDLRSTPLHQLLIASRLHQQNQQQQRLVNDCSADQFLNNRSAMTTINRAATANRPQPNQQPDRSCSPEEIEAEDDLYSDHDSYDGPPTQQQQPMQPMPTVFTGATSQTLLASPREQLTTVEDEPRLSPVAAAVATTAADLLGLAAGPLCSNPALSVIAAAAAAATATSGPTSGQAVRTQSGKKKRVSSSPQTQHNNTNTTPQQHPISEPANTANNNNSTTTTNSNNNRYLRHYTEACPICDRRFKSIKWLQSHVMNDHKNEIGNLFNLLVQVLICGGNSPAASSLELNGTTPSIGGQVPPPAATTLTNNLTASNINNGQETNTGNTNLIGNLIAAQLLAQHHNSGQQLATAGHHLPSPLVSSASADELSPLSGGGGNQAAMGTLASLIGLQQQIQLMSQSGPSSMPTAATQSNTDTGKAGSQPAVCQQIQQQRHLAFGAGIQQQQQPQPALGPLLAPHLAPAALQRLMQQQQQLNQLHQHHSQAATFQQQALAAAANHSLAASEYMKFISSDNE